MTQGNLSKTKNLFLPGLNGIRAIAAFTVLLCHTDQWSYYAGVKSLGFWDNHRQSNAVILFFVLSGFLITYLLLKEKEQFKKIDLRKFYVRRILRIWPVYYAVLITGTTLLILFPSINRGPVDNLPITITFYGLLISNIGAALGYGPELIGILWSIGVEEQFYAFWPIVVQKCKKAINGILLVLFAIIVLKLIFVLSDNKKALTLLGWIPFECMAIGSISAYLIQVKSAFLKIVFHPVSQVIAWAFLMISLIHGTVHIDSLSRFEKFYLSVIYAVVIMNVSCNSKTLISLENKILSFFGKISYGIYAYHPIVLFLISFVLKSILIKVNYNFQLIILFVSEITATTLLAYLSYYYYESWFIKRKEKFVTIKLVVEEDTNEGEIHRYKLKLKALESFKIKSR